MNHVLTPAQTESAPASQLMISQATELGLQILIFNASLQPSLSKSGGTLTDFTKKAESPPILEEKKTRPITMRRAKPLQEPTTH